MHLLYLVFIALILPSHLMAETLMYSNINKAQDIVIKPDSPLIIQMDNDVASVIVGNPNYVRAIMDTPRTLILMPESSGSTTLSVTGTSGENLLDHRLIVSATNAANYLTIKRACINSAMPECVPLSLYYCSDRCHAIGHSGANAGTTISAQDSIAAQPGTTSAEGS